MRQVPAASRKAIGPFPTVARYRQSATRLRKNELAGCTMSWSGNAAITAVSGGVISVVALLAAVPSAKADELADLRPNQDLPRQRLDQLAQVPPASPSTHPIGVGT